MIMYYYARWCHIGSLREVVQVDDPTIELTLEREEGREGERESKGEGERERERESVCVCVLRFATKFYIVHTQLLTCRQ